MDDELPANATQLDGRAPHDPTPALPTLSYWLLTAGHSDGYTPFQGFGLDITHPAYPDLIRLLSVLPASSTEIFAPAEALPDQRRPISRKRASIVGLPSFLELQKRRREDNVISIILGLPAHIEAVLGIAEEPRPIFVTTTPIEGALAIEGYKGHPAQLLDAAIRDALLERLVSPNQEEIKAMSLREPFRDGNEPSRVAGVTVPNETLSESLGHTYAGFDRIRPDVKDSYVDAILNSVDRARALIGEKSIDTILYAPSMVRRLYAFGSAFWNNLFRKIRSREVRDLIKDGVFRNPGYSGFTFASDDPENANPYKDQAAGAMLSVRQIELRLTAAGVGALAANGLQPALRLPNAVNFHNATLREIERHANRTDARGQQLLQRNYAKLARDLHDQIHPRIVDNLRSRTEAITLVADAPLEWLRIDGLPLMIRHELSRIGMTPGNLMLAQCIEAGTVVLPSSVLTDILIIRSFNANDPVRRMLDTAIGGFDLKRVDTKFVDVTSREELITALNAFEGAIVVFDCHGGHGGDDGNGWLRIGSEKVDVWELAHVARIPPIAVLSACSTFALAGSHASVASGLIRSGAITVVGTFLPVDAIRSALFVARLLFRIDAFLPALKQLDKNFVTWRTLVSTFLRMSYATDLMMFFIHEKQWLDNSMFVRIGNKANHDINRLHPGWYQRLLRRISRTTGRPISEIQTVIDTESPLMETMYYCQTGRPETIGIFLD
jgi:hypothetical protein